jgi:phosphohistidine phosphatase
MYLYLVQHGEAKREEEDPERGLTQKGLEDVRRAVDFATSRGLRVGAVYHSGKKRGLQTASFFGDFLRPGGGVVSSNSLAPNDDPSVWAERARRAEEDLMIVGHLPHLAMLAGLLLCGDAERQVIDFKMGGIVCLKRSETDQWMVEWMVVPEVLC